MTEEKTIVDVLKQVYLQLRTLDPSVIIYRWANADSDAPNISNVTSVPLAIGRLRRYCPRIAPKREGSDVYITIRLGSTISSDQLREQAGWWLQSHKHGLWPCAVQAEQVSCVGWLLYSSREVDTASLASAISNRIGINVGLRWRPISVGRTIPGSSEHTRAIHVEVAGPEESIAKAKLRAIYRTSATTDFPNSIKIRLVPEAGPYSSPALRIKIECLIARQAHF